MSVFGVSKRKFVFLTYAKTCRKRKPPVKGQGQGKRMISISTAVVQIMVC